MQTHQNKSHLSIPNHLLRYVTQSNEIFSAFLRNITKKLQLHKGLKKLTLNLKGIQLDHQNLKEISRNLLKKLHNLENLKIILSSDPIFQDRYFEFLLRTLKTFRSLRVFEVALPKRLEETSRKSRISHLIKALQKSAPRLQEAKFTLIDDTYWGLYGYGLPFLEKWGFKRLGCLQNLSLHLRTSVFINDEQLDLSALKSLTRLESLDIALVDLPDNPSWMISKELAFDPSKTFPNLKRFKWQVLYNSLSKTTEIELFGYEIAARLKGLQDFGLKCQQDGELMNQDIKGKTQCLTSLKVDLNWLSMRISFGKLNSSDSNALIEALAGQRLKKIHTLSLGFIQCKGLNNKILAKLGRILGQNMKELRFLRLYFEKAQPFSSSFKKRFMAVLGFKGASNKGISQLGAMLSQGCQNLEFVSLGFWRYSHISDKGVMSLCSSLSQIRSLRTARFQFKFCPKVSSVSVKHAKEKFGPQRDVKFTTI